MAEMKRTYKAVFELDEGGWWLARIPSVHGCHMQGRTLDQARRRLREALGLWIEDPDEAVFDEDIRLPREFKAAITRSRRARERAEQGRAQAQRETKEAAQALVGDLGVGLRDAGELLGLSHQRVQQLVSD
jgi:predicted RNase H-like HicB family nuclease